MKNESLLNIIQPKPNTTVLIYDVHASESGALSILNDLYNQVVNYPDKSIQWIFAVSTPNYEEMENVKVLRFPWVKKSWFHRLFFDNITTRKIIKKYLPNKVFSLQNKGINFYKGSQYVYLHLPFILTNYRFHIKNDGKKLWLYQNILRKNIFSSLKKADFTIVQTKWMKDALIKQAHIESEKIIINYPNIEMHDIGQFHVIPQQKTKFFYPATAFSYKNHMTLLKAISYAVKHGLKDYEVFFTIREDENAYTKQLSHYAQEKHLNIVFHGPISREEVFLRYQDSILLFPSFVESFGLPLLEAKLSGTPIVAADMPFSREILHDYDKVLFFNSTDEIEMGEKILEILCYNEKGE